MGECEIPIPREVMEGETRQHWYPLMGRQANAQENQGDILIIMSFVVNTFLIQSSSQIEKIYFMRIIKKT